MTVSKTIDFPQRLMKVQENSFFLASVGEHFTSVYNPAPRVAGPRYKLWKCDLSWNVLHEQASIDQRYEFQAFIGSLDGGSVAMRIWDAGRSLPKGKAAGISRSIPSPQEYFRIDGSNQYSLAVGARLVEGSNFATVHANAPRYADSIVLSGLLANEVVFYPGDLIEVGGNLHEVQLRCLSDANGRSAVKLNNRLWKPALAGDLVRVAYATGQFILTDNEQGRASRGLVTSSASVSAVEVPSFE